MERIARLFQPNRGGEEEEEKEAVFWWKLE